jgi:hypothetical protein
MEADLDLGDKLRASDKELSGDKLIIEQYTSQKSKSYNHILYPSSTNDFKSKSTIDPVLHRPTTPAQLRQSIAAHTVDSLANSLAIGDMYTTESNGFENTIFPGSIKQPLSSNDQQKQRNSVDNDPPRSNSSASLRSSRSSIIDLSNTNDDTKS